jgi:hypothetical protein
MPDQRSRFRCSEENSVFISADSLTLSFVTPASIQLTLSFSDRERPTGTRTS